MSAVPSLTLFRQAVTPAAYPDEAPVRTASAAAIIAEIAERLDELDEIKRESGADLITQLACIASRSRRAFRLTVQLLHGNTSEICSSYQDQANKRGVTKQDVHYEFVHELAKIERLYPELYAVILSMRAQATRHEDPIGRGEVARAGDGGLEG